LPEGLAFGTNGVLYVGNDGANLINRVSTSGFVSVFATNTVQPYGVAFDSKGNLYAACQSSPAGRVRMITPQGVVTNFSPTITAPYGLAIDAGDNVFVTSSSGSIYKITPAGTSSTFSFVSGATGLAFDKQGNLFVAVTSGSVTRITPAGASSTFATGLGSSLVGLAFDNNGNLYVASYVSGVISKIAPDQTVTSFATVPGNPSFIAVFPPPKFDPGPISIARLGEEVVVTWAGNFVLQSAPAAAGAFADLPGATSPYTNAINSADAAFFRLRN
jgi:streptogramin lyase